MHEQVYAHINPVLHKMNTFGSTINCLLHNSAGVKDTM